MSVLQKQPSAVLMLCATIPRDRTTVHVNLNILEMDKHAKVNIFSNNVTYQLT